METFGQTGDVFLASNFSCQTIPSLLLLQSNAAEYVMFLSALMFCGVKFNFLLFGKLDHKRSRTAQSSVTLRFRSININDSLLLKPEQGQSSLPNTALCLEMEKLISCVSSPSLEHYHTCQITNWSLMSYSVYSFTDLLPASDMWHHALFQGRVRGKISLNRNVMWPYLSKEMWRCWLFWKSCFTNLHVHKSLSNWVQLETLKIWTCCFMRRGYENNNWTKLLPTIIKHVDNSLLKRKKETKTFLFMFSDFCVT